MIWFSVPASTNTPSTNRGTGEKLYWVHSLPSSKLILCVSKRIHITNTSVRTSNQAHKISKPVRTRARTVGVHFNPMCLHNYALCFKSWTLKLHQSGVTPWPLRVKWVKQITVYHLYGTWDLFSHKLTFCPQSWCVNLIIVLFFDWVSASPKLQLLSGDPDLVKPKIET